MLPLAEPTTRRLAHHFLPGGLGLPPGTSALVTWLTGLVAALARAGASAYIAWWPGQMVMADPTPHPVHGGDCARAPGDQPDRDAGTSPS
ncbi:MAG: hypothetical protein U0075_24720 [Thermomicrobiales bacterium]